VKDLAKQLVASGKGILAVDDFIPGITKRFAALNIPCTDETRRDYREMLFTSEGMKFISGVILFDETFRQSARDGTPIPSLIQNAGALDFINPMVRCLQNGAPYFQLQVHCLHAMRKLPMPMR
jgi:fructose-bisphosphate aldolase, class I